MKIQHLIRDDRYIYLLIATLNGAGYTAEGSHAFIQPATIRDTPGKPFDAAATRGERWRITFHGPKRKTPQTGRLTDWRAFRRANVGGV